MFFFHGSYLNGFHSTTTFSCVVSFVSCYGSISLPFSNFCFSFFNFLASDLRLTYFLLAIHLSLPHILFPILSFRVRTSTTKTITSNASNPIEDHTPHFLSPDLLRLSDRISYFASFLTKLSFPDTVVLISHFCDRKYETIPKAIVHSTVYTAKQRTPFDMVVN